MFELNYCQIKKASFLSSYQSVKVAFVFNSFFFIHLSEFLDETPYDKDISIKKKVY